MRGLVLETEYDHEGNVIHQRLCPAGSLLDLQVVRGAPHSTTATALTKAEVCSLPLESFNHWLGPRPSPARAVLQLALTEVQAQESALARTHGSAISKVAAFLLEHLRVGDEQPLELQHQLMAGLLHLRPETFSRALTRLRKSGTISGRNRIYVRDREALSAVANPPVKTS